MIVFEIIFRFITRKHFRRRAAQEPASGISAGFFYYFLGCRRRAGRMRVGNSVSPFASALAFHYLCPKMSGTQASPAAR